MRCPDCNKFVAFDTGNDPEIDVDVDADGTITGTVRIALTCEECGQELKEATFDVDASVEQAVAKHREEHPECKDSDLSVNDGGGSITERTQTETPSGRKIRNPRYAKRYYGAEATFTVTCDECGEEIATEEWSDEVQASGMDELV